MELVSQWQSPMVDGFDEFIWIRDPPLALACWVTWWRMFFAGFRDCPSTFPRLKLMCMILGRVCCPFSGRL